MKPILHDDSYDADWELFIENLKSDKTPLWYKLSFITKEKKP